jgi:hypothetical protein
MNFNFLTYLDNHNVQPSEGASRATGGFMRGNATGNLFSIADASDLDVLDAGIQAKGLIKVYKALVDTTSVKPFMVVKSGVEPSLVPILKKLSRSYSPVSSKLLHHFKFLSLTLL